MPSFADVNLSDIPSQVFMPVETELELTIESAEAVTSKKDPSHQGINLRFTSEAHPDAEAVFDWLAIPFDDAEPRVERMQKLNMQAFIGAFDITQSLGVNPNEEWVGKKGWAILKADTDQNNLPSVRIKSYVPRG